ncbi:hypothetical protein C1J03_05385 [Sulfitobacter sp. SK012]|nr:hypothetical protein C1J03_05385 [Sulfitobacter sp. SK012]
MKITIEQLQKSITYLAQAIQNRPDGDLYIPIFERLEEEIQMRRSTINTRSRIGMIASHSSTHNELRKTAA